MKPIDPDTTALLKAIRDYAEAYLRYEVLPCPSWHLEKGRVAARVLVLVLGRQPSAEELEAFMSASGE